MERLNYSTHAIESLHELAASIGSKGFNAEVEFISDWITDSVKFMLPCSGRIMDANYSKNNPLYFVHLPFKKIAIEFAIKQNPGEGMVSSPKRLVLCEELSFEEYAEKFLNDFSSDDGYRKRLALDVKQRLNCSTHVVVIYPINYIEKDGRGWWAPNPFYVLLSDAVRINEIVGPDGELDWSLDYVTYLPIGLYGKTAIKNNCQMKDVITDTSDEIHAFLQLMTVLSCSNVETTDAKAPDKLNKKRVANKRTPFFDYKTLVVKMNQTKLSGGTKISGRASPREHLRRGHPRNLQNGDRVWVSPTTVNAGLGKSVNKDYALLF